MLPTLKTNISPKTWWLETENSFWNGPFSGDIRSFAGGSTYASLRAFVTSWMLPGHFFSSYRSGSCQPLKIVIQYQLQPPKMQKALNMETLCMSFKTEKTPHILKVGVFFSKLCSSKLGSSSANRDDNLEKVWNHHPVLYIHDIIHHYKTASKGTIVFKVSAYSIQSSLMSPFFPTDVRPHGWNIGWTQAKIGVFTAHPKNARGRPED